MLIKKSVILAMAVVFKRLWLSFAGGYRFTCRHEKCLFGGWISVSCAINLPEAMEISSVPLASSPETAGLIVKIFDEDSQRRVLSLNSGGTANDFELGYRFDYEIVDSKNKVLSARQPVEIKREYFNDSAGYYR